MNRTETQCKKVLEYMETHGKITQRDAIWFGCYRLSARIYDLKEAGHCINATIKQVVNADGSISHIAEYSLGDKENE